MWDAVRWTLAGQVAALFPLGDDAQKALVEDDPPEDFFQTLRQMGAYNDAISFLAFALPRRQAIAWAHRCIGATARRARLMPADTAAYSAAGAWLADGADELRWTAHDAANRAELRTPEALLAYAVFVSGGSLTSADCPQQVPAPPDLVGKLVSAALLMAATRAAGPLVDQAKSDFIDVGETFARDESGPTKHLDPAIWSDNLAGHAPNAQNRKPKRVIQRPVARSGP